MELKYIKISKILKKEIEEKKVKFLSERAVMERFKVSNVTARRVLNDLEEEGYIERKVGKGSIVIEKSKEIGIISYYIRDAFDLFIPEIIKGVEEKAEKKGYYLHLYTTRKKSITQTKNSLFHLIDKKKLIGILILSPLPEDDIRFLKEEEIPFVVLANFYSKIECSYVIYDYKGVTIDICRKLYNEGKRRIGILITTKGEYGVKRSGDLIYEGYKEFLREKGIEEETVLEVGRHMDLEEVKKVMKMTDTLIIGNTFISDDILDSGIEGEFILYTHREIENPRVISFPLRDYGKMGFEILERLIKGYKKDIKIILKPKIGWGKYKEKGGELL